MDYDLEVLWLQAAEITLEGIKQLLDEIDKLRESKKGKVHPDLLNFELHHSVERRTSHADK